MGPGGGQQGRRARVERRTRETEIVVSVDLDGQGRVAIETPIGFLTHMLEALGRHALLDLEIRAVGDLEVDEHHTVEDLGLVLGEALSQALGDRSGISRAGWARHPMDEALCDVAIDICGRACLVYHATFQGERVGELPLELVHDFLNALCSTLGAGLHVDIVRGRSDHHRVEALFKALARALRMAVAREPRLGGQIPSTKGTIDGSPG